MIPLDKLLRMREILLNMGCDVDMARAATRYTNPGVEALACGISHLEMIVDEALEPVETQDATQTQDTDEQESEAPLASPAWDYRK